MKAMEQGGSCVRRGGLPRLWLELAGGFGGLGRVAVQRQATGRGDGQHLEEIPAVHGHAELSVQSLFTGDSGSTRKATMWVICSGVSQLCSPKRGMLVHAVKALEL